ncbi:MAG TPA: nucleotidyl transferase AbiEii/AbiGii toxin family protein [Phycisphaerae bacterium]|nr:nucleotidyl transferase AbiEii/AbiGii toxin family protein [Phycisphaerae bacterium]
MAKKKQIIGASENLLDKVKRLAIIAMVSDGQLMERLVLKGGNAIDLVFGVSTRASLDLDFSMEKDFSPEEMTFFRGVIEGNLQELLRPEGFEPFEVTLQERPEAITSDIAGFWGGYRVEFRLIQSEKYKQLVGDAAALRRSALVLGELGRFQIDISRFEYCAPKEHHSFDGHKIFVYSPAMLVIEKFRAICQQMPEYSPVIKRNRPPTARARDFVDIYAVVRKFAINPKSPQFASLLQDIFYAKRVPLELLGKIPDSKEFHEPDFESVKSTVRPAHKLYDFDVYFNFVVGICDDLKPLWKKEPPSI